MSKKHHFTHLLSVARILSAVTSHVLITEGRLDKGRK